MMRRSPEDIRFRSRSTMSGPNDPRPHHAGGGLVLVRARSLWAPCIARLAVQAQRSSAWASATGTERDISRPLGCNRRTAGLRRRRRSPVSPRRSSSAITTTTMSAHRESHRRHPTGELAKLDMASMQPGFMINGLKREELLATNSMILHEAYFASSRQRTAASHGVPRRRPAREGLRQPRKMARRVRRHGQGARRRIRMGGFSPGRPASDSLTNQWAGSHHDRLADGRGACRAGHV